MAFIVPKGCASVTADFMIVAHRGATGKGAPENTVEAFKRALDLGADGIEFDLRLTRDHVPVVFHDFYLDDVTTASGPICARSYHELSSVRVVGRQHKTAPAPIPQLVEVLDGFGGRIDLEIEIKGPEPESAPLIADTLRPYRELWPSIQVTSFEPSLLTAFRLASPEIATAVLFSQSEYWMGADAVAYLALHKARLSGTNRVHLHPTQLTAEVTSQLRNQGIEIHAWDVNTTEAIRTAIALGIRRICTDDLGLALRLRSRRSQPR